MAFKNIEEFIHHHKLNYSPNHLKKHLLTQGYPEHQVNKSIRKAYRDVLETTVDSYIHTHHKQEIHKYLQYAGHHPKEIEKAIEKSLIKYVRHNKSASPKEIKQLLLEKGHHKHHIHKAIEVVRSPTWRVTKVLIILFSVIALMLFAFSNTQTKCESQLYTVTNTISNQTELDFASKNKLTNEINLYGNDALKELKNLACLQRLEISSPLITDISSLRSLKDLEFLIISKTSINNLEPISSMKYLEYLDISNTKVTSLEKISNLNSLTFLRVHNTTIEDFSPLSSLNSLESLDASNSYLDDLSFVRGLPKIKNLVIRSTKVKTLAPLANTNVQTLDLAGLRILDLSPLTKMNKLEKVNFVYKGESSIHSSITDNIQKNISSVIFYNR